MKQQVILKKWRARIIKAKARGHFTEHDIGSARDWSKCAVGERDCMCEKVIPTHDSIFQLQSEAIKNRIYTKVTRVGTNFYTNVLKDNFEGALKTLKEIESIPKERFYR